MYKFNFIVFLILSLISCSDKTQQNEKVSQAIFDLHKVQQKYADIELKVADISEQSYQNSSSLAVTLSTPLNPDKDFQSFFKVSNKEGQKVAGNWILSASGLVVRFPEIDPSSTYIVDVYKDLKSATGKVLKNSINQKVITRKMPSQVSFASQGSILPAKLAQGLPVISVNINQVDVDFHRIKADKISHFIQSWANSSGRSKQSHYYLQEYTKYTELIYSGRFELNPPKNTRHSTHLDLTPITSIKQPGIYLAVMKPAGSYQYETPVTFFTISDIGLHARVYPDRLAVRVSSLETGKPLPNIKLSLIDSKEQTLDEVDSDSQGSAVFLSPSNKARLLLAKNQHSIALLRLNAAALDLSDFKVAGRPYKATEIFTYGPRDLYRPGETVKINALLRDADGKSMIAPPLKAIIKRPDGQKIKFFTLYPDKQTPNQGFYQTEFKLPANARTGKWSLELKTGNNNAHQYQFQVEAFLPERMELVLGDPAIQHYSTDSLSTLKIPVSGQYLYGAPAAKNRLSSKVMLKSNRNPVSVHQEYVFGMADEKPPIEFFEAQDIKLDEQGKALLEIPSRWKQVNNTSYTIKVINSLFETGGRPVTRTIDYQLWPQQALLGIRSQYNKNEIPANTELSFDIIKSTLDGKLQGNTDVLATLTKERRDYYWEFSDSEGWHQEYSQKNFKVFEKRISLDEKKSSVITVPVEWGWYLLTVKDLTSKQTSSLRFRSGTGWRSQQQSSSARPDQIVLKLDKTNYQSDEIAQLQVIPPYAGSGFITVESSEKPLWFQRVDIPAEGANFKIPLSKLDRHDIYISAIVFRPGDNQEKITPNRALGIIHLPVNRTKQKLAVTIDTPKTVIKPEQTLTTPIKVAGISANQETYVTLAAVDVGVLNITDYKTPDPFTWFYEPRRYAVEQHDLYNKIIELSAGGLIKPRFGGDADKHAGGARPDSSVKIVSLFSQSIKADDQGIAKIDLDLPDFNGRLRLMAVAFNSSQLGATEAEITVAAPIIAEASLPRFLASGDKSIMTLDLRNQSGEEQNLQLQISSNAPVNMENISRTINLADKDKQIFHFPIKADQALGSASITLSLSNDKTGDQAIKINRQWQLGVRPAYPAMNTTLRKIITAGEKIKLSSALENMLVSSAHANLSISSQPPIDINNHLKSLLRYPYGCLEQTISSTYPWLSINPKNQQSFGLDKIKINNKKIDFENKSKYVDKSLSILAGMQRSNGSFGLWSNRNAEEHWLTAYAADFLLDTREKGYPVPSELLDKTFNRLTQYLNHRGNMYGERYSQVPEHYNFAYKAYAAYVLSRVNKAPLGSLKTLFDHHRSQSKSALPLTHLGLALYKQGDKNRGIQALKESLKKPRANNVYLSDYGSRLRDLSLMVYLFQKHSLLEQESNKLVFELADELTNRQYLSTQERNALFQAGIQLKSKEHIEWEGELILASKKIQLKLNNSYNESFTASDIPQTLQFNLPKQAKNSLFLSFSLNAYPSQAPKVQMDKIILERNYYDLEGNTVKAGRHKTGDILLVHLTVLAKQRISDALLIDFIPAGFELENQNLANNIKIDSFKIGGTSIQDMQSYHHIKYQQYLDDRFIAALDLQKNKHEHLFYLVRAVSSGEYSNPSPYLEDMYRPYIRAIGREFNTITVVTE